MNVNAHGYREKQLLLELQDTKTALHRAEQEIDAQRKVLDNATSSGIPSVHPAHNLFLQQQHGNNLNLSRPQSRGIDFDPLFSGDFGPVSPLGAVGGGLSGQQNILGNSSKDLNFQTGSSSSSSSAAHGVTTGAAATTHQQRMAMLNAHQNQLLRGSGDNQGAAMNIGSPPHGVVQQALNKANPAGYTNPISEGLLEKENDVLRKQVTELKDAITNMRMAAEKRNMYDFDTGNNKTLNSKTGSKETAPGIPEGRIFSPGGSKETSGGGGASASEQQQRVEKMKEYYMDLILQKDQLIQDLQTKVGDLGAKNERLAAEKNKLMELSNKLRFELMRVNEQVNSYKSGAAGGGRGIFGFPWWMQFLGFDKFLC